MKKCIPLEPAAEAVSMQSSKPPYIFQLPPEQGRKILEKAQDTPVCMHLAESFMQMVNTGSGRIPIYFIYPQTTEQVQSIIFYIHGAGWVFGSYHTHEKLVRELAARTGSLVIFPEYSRSPEAKYPTALEQCYAILCSLKKLTQNIFPSIDMRTLTVAGDSVGGNMAIAMTLLAKYQNGPYINKQLLYYPVTNACFTTGSYREFACGYYLYREGMKWFWDQYTRTEADRRHITTSPLIACAEQLRGLPDAMIINGEADVLRDEGECFARKLRMADVDVTAVRFQGIIHDFVMLNALDQTNACRSAMDVSTDWINRKNNRILHPDECCQF